MNVAFPVWGKEVAVTYRSSDFFGWGLPHLQLRGHRPLRTVPLPFVTGYLLAMVMA